MNLPEPGTQGRVLIWLSATSITRYATLLADFKNFRCVFPLFLNSVRPLSAGERSEWLEKKVSGSIWFWSGTITNSSYVLYFLN